MIATIGGAGSGLVWGWYAGGVGRPRRAGSIGAFAAAGIALVGEAFALAGSLAAVALLVALGVGVGLRAVWIARLRGRASFEGGT